MREYFDFYVGHLKTRLFIFSKWSLFSILSGIIIGGVGTLFYFCMTYATNTRGTYPWLIFFLPAAGLFIVGAYRFMHDEKDTGTNLVLSAIHSGKSIPLRMAPLIFISTVLTHLFGGSAGREGAALQLGGSIGNSLGRLFRFDEKDQHIMIMCGMSAAFSALFGTPMAAAIFSMEVVSVGIMHYAALVPCVISALIAHEIALHFGIMPEHFSITDLPDFSLKTAIIIVIFAVLCAGVSVFFCHSLRISEKLYRHFLPNTYLRICVGGGIVILLTLLVGNQDYNGAGMFIIERCFQGESVFPAAFLLKILFTAVTLGAGYKGGEIVPTLFIGATFGYAFGNITGFSPELCTAVGMGSIFCGVTNAPISSLLICFELFGFEGMPYFLLAIAFSYMLSGYSGLYSSQKIVYSKYKTEFINLKTH